MHQPKPWAFEGSQGLGGQQEGARQTHSHSLPWDLQLWVVTQEIKEELGGPALPLQQGKWCWCQAAAVSPAWCVLWKAAALAARLGCEALTCGSSPRKGRTLFLSSLGLGCGGGRGCSSVEFLRLEQAVFGFLCFCLVKPEGFLWL